MRKAKSFRSYARSRNVTDVVGGEFAAYAKSDPYFPDAKTWGELRTYLNGRGAPHEIFVAARAAWKDYRRHLKA
jgi:YozE SAM-like fold